MKTRKGAWLVEGTTEAYKSEWIQVFEDEVVRPDGESSIFAVVKIKPGVSVLAIDKENTVYLTREYRYAIEQESLEVVSGAIEEGEAPAIAARRELKEELGIVAGTWIEMGYVHPLTSMLHAPASLFLARELSFFEPETEPWEAIEMVKMKLSDAVRLVMESKITHAPSCALILKANEYLRGPGEEQ